MEILYAIQSPRTLVVDWWGVYSPLFWVRTAEPFPMASVVSLLDFIGWLFNTNYVQSRLHELLEPAVDQLI